jgi:hypothetical protein
LAESSMENGLMMYSRRETSTPAGRPIHFNGSLEMGKFIIFFQNTYSDPVYRLQKGFLL